MGRDRTRVLLCAAVSLVLIVAATLVMDWYRASYETAVEELGKVSVAIDLRSVHTCTALRVCTTAPLSPWPGMFPTLATVTLWSSLAFAALVVFQAGIRLLTGNANDPLAKFGYMFALTTISITIATAYLFGAETDGPSLEIAARLGSELHRTWAPATLLVGLIAGFATLYMSVAPDSSDLGDTYRPVTLVSPAAASERPASQPVPVPAAARAATRPLRPSGRGSAVQPSTDLSPPHGALPLPGDASPSRSNEPTLPEVGLPRSNVQTHPTGDIPAAVMQPANPAADESGKAIPARAQSGGHVGSGPLRPPGSGPIARSDAAGALRPVTGPMAPNRRAPTAPGAERPSTGPQAQRRAPTAPVGTQRQVTGQYTAQRRAPTEPLPSTRRVTGQVPVPTPVPTGRMPVIGPATITSQVPLIEPTPTGGLSSERAKSGPILPVPEHLRNRLSYVAITAELTGGGIDARREDGTSRLVLWRDVVGVVVRRMPPVFDDAMFVDIVSTARSTLRILPWTRLTGDLAGANSDARPHAIIEYVLAKCPAAKVDPATRQFLDTGEAAQIPDLETLKAHDARLA